jgi:phospholipid transport system substrate-binding protein
MNTGTDLRAMAMKRGFSCLLILGALASPSFATCPAEHFIHAAGAAFMGAARSGNPNAFANAATKYTDLRALALFSLGPYRKNLPKDREAEFVLLTKKFLGQFMSQYASKFSGNGITITNCAGNIIATKLSTGQGIVFKLRGGKRIEDVSVSGVWLAQTLRGRFVSVIKNNGGDVGALLGWLEG